MNISQFLTWLVAGGAVIAVSWLCEQSAWFEKQTVKVKRVIQFGASALLGCAAMAINQFVPAATLEMLTPYFAIVAGAFSMIYLNQAFHSVQKLVNK